MMQYFKVDTYSDTSLLHRIIILRKSAYKSNGFESLHSLLLQPLTVQISQWAHLSGLQLTMMEITDKLTTSRQFRLTE